MKRIVGTLAVCMFAASTAYAVVASDSITVTAANGGVFTFDIVAAAYAFGTVDANGTLNIGGTQAITGVRGATSSTYTATTATTWALASAPPRTVRIFNASTTFSGAPVWGNSDRLAMQIPTAGLVGGGTPTGCLFKTFTTTGDGGASGCGSGNLLEAISAGNGANSVTGNLDFRLTVDDADGTGSNTWVVILTAAAP